MCVSDNRFFHFSRHNVNIFGDLWRLRGSLMLDVVFNRLILSLELRWRLIENATMDIVSFT